MVLFQKGKIVVRKLDLKDNVLLAKWLSDPKVLQYYEGRDNPHDIEKVNEVFFNKDPEVVGCIVKYGGVEIGYIQFYLVDDTTSEIKDYPPSETVYGIDQFIGEVDYWNKGIGTLLVTAMVDYLINEKSADRVIMDPQVTNARALRCYEKCGFKKVRILPKQEFHEGEYKDCWLIEYKK